MYSVYFLRFNILAEEVLNCAEKKNGKFHPGKKNLYPRKKYKIPPVKIETILKILPEKKKLNP